MRHRAGRILLALLALLGSNLALGADGTERQGRMNNRCADYLTDGVSLRAGRVVSGGGPYHFYSYWDAANQRGELRKRLDKGDTLQPHQQLWITDVRSPDGRVTCVATPEGDGWLLSNQLVLTDEGLVPQTARSELVGMWVDAHKGTIVIEALGDDQLLIREAYNCDGPCNHFIVLDDIPGSLHEDGVWVFHDPGRLPKCTIRMRRIGEVLHVRSNSYPHGACGGGLNTHFIGSYRRSRTGELDCGEFRHSVKYFGCLHDLPRRQWPP